MTCLSYYVYFIWKNNHYDEYFDKISNIDITLDKKESIFNQDQQKIEEEMIVRGQEEYKKVIFEFQGNKNEAFVKEQLTNVSKCAIFFKNIIDFYDDVNVSLSVYD